MYQKPGLTRFGTFRELTRFGCSGTSDLVTPGSGASGDHHSEHPTGADGHHTTKVCFHHVSGM